MNRATILGVLSVLLASGCASTITPPELASARTAYQRAAAGPAGSLNPTDLHVAKESLDTAEASFTEDGNTQVTRDLGYTAMRRSETAESRARTMQAMMDSKQVVDQMHESTATQLAQTKGALSATGQALQTETERRQAAEKRAAQAAADLAKFASVKQEARGMVITLSGGVLFTSAESTLMPAAQLKLNDVAKALTEQDPESTMVVEGHTDSQGTAASNKTLSEARARAVRDYLVSRGIAADRITSQGFGPDRSVGDNKTAEGRANNRRVEIVVKPKG